MKIDRTKNARHNIRAGLLLNGLTILSPFLLRLIIVHTIGVEYVGLSDLFSSVLNILNMVELGIGSAIVYSMYEPVAKDDLIKTGAILKLYRKVYHLLALIVFAIGIAVTPFLPRLIKGECPSDINLYFLYFIYLFNSISVYLFGSYRVSLFSAYQREDIKNKVTFYVRLLIYAAQFIILLIFKNYYIYAFLIALGSVAINLVLSIKSRKYFPNILEQGKLDKKEIKEITKGVGGLFLNKLASTIRGSFDSVFLTMYSGLVENAIYSNYYLALMSLNGILLVFTQSIRAGIGNSLVLQDEKQNYSDYISLQMAYMLISGFAIVCFANFCQPFITFFFGSHLIINNNTFILLIFYLFVLKIIDVNNTFIDASGIWWNNKWATIFDATFNFFMDMILGKLFGLFGILLATVLSIYLFQFWMQTYICFKKIFPKHSMFKYCLMQHIIGITIFLSLLIGERIIRFCGINNIYINSIIVALFSCVLFGSIFYIIFRKNEYFIKAASIAKNVVVRRRK